MRDTSVDHVQDFILSSLLVELMDDVAGDINYLNDSHVIQTTRSNLEVLFLILGVIALLNLFENCVCFIFIHNIA